MDILYKHPAPQSYRLIENSTILIPYWITPVIKRHGISPFDIYDAVKMRDKLALNDMALLQAFKYHDFAEGIKWSNTKNSGPLYLQDSSTARHDTVNDENAKYIEDIAFRVAETIPYKEIESLLRIPDEQYQSLRNSQSFYKIELTSNNFILITIEAGFLNVLEAREDAKQFFSDYLKARYTCETIHEVSKTNLFNWYLASLA